jgi:branched-chain amino acid transport system ATP-binding protein
MLETRNVTCRFAGLVAVNDLSISVRAGQFFGIIGPNGAGKTTFFNLLSGIFHPSSGQIILDGAETQHLPSHKVARLGLGRTFQIVRPFGELTVLENVLAGMAATHCGNMLSALGQRRRRKHIDAARDLLRRTDLETYADELAVTLPLGLLRRLEIARALASRPKLLLLDESFSGLSHREADTLAELVTTLNAEGLTIILIEHNMQITMRLCERLAVLDRGIKIAEGSPAEIQNDWTVVKAYLGSEHDA